MINSRFTVGVHLLALLALGGERCPGVPLTSEIASESVNTNPVVVRRILGCLRKAGMVSSQSGPNGGWCLRREPAAITLQEVYRAVEDDTLFSMHHSPPSSDCLIGRNIQDALSLFFGRAEAAMEAKLAEQTVADVVAAVLDRAAAQAS